jgi:hypothetical protein
MRELRDKTDPCLALGVGTVTGEVIVCVRAIARSFALVLPPFGVTRGRGDHPFWKGAWTCGRDMSCLGTHGETSE